MKLEAFYSFTWPIYQLLKVIIGQKFIKCIKKKKGLKKSFFFSPIERVSTDTVYIPCLCSRCTTLLRENQSL